MAKGQASKDIIIEKLLETFDNSFKFNKEIRIPMTENGESIQIKCVLTCSKVNVESGEDNALPTKAKAKAVTDAGKGGINKASSESITASQSEVDAISELMESLGVK